VLSQVFPAASAPRSAPPSPSRRIATSGGLSKISLNARIHFRVLSREATHRAAGSSAAGILGGKSAPLLFNPP
jgi:hypothetical protein